MTKRIFAYLALTTGIVVVSVAGRPDPVTGCAEVVLLPVDALRFEPGYQRHPDDALGYTRDSVQTASGRTADSPQTARRTPFFPGLGSHLRQRCTGRSGQPGFASALRSTTSWRDDTRPRPAPGGIPHPPWRGRRSGGHLHHRCQQDFGNARGQDLDGCKTDLI